MQIVVDEIDGNYYVDLVISPSELKRLKSNEMINGETYILRRKYYLGIRMQGIWDYDEEEDQRFDEDLEGF